MFSIMVIAIGVVVLLFGKRLSVLGAAVGALLGVGLLRLFPGADSWITLLIPLLLAVIGFMGAAFAKGIVNIVLLAVGTLAGAVIVLGFLDLFQINSGLFDWILVILGAIIGLVFVMRFKDLAMIILAGLIGGLLITRGLSAWLPILEGALGTLLVLVLAGGSVVYEGGFLDRKKGAATPPPTQ